MFEVAFEDVVGQKQIVKMLKFYHDSFVNAGEVPSLLFLGKAGQGKTFLASKFAKSIGREACIINCGELKSVDQLINTYFLQNKDKDVSFIFDEVHEINKKVETFLLSLLNPTNEPYFSITINNQELFMEKSQFNFMACTTESQCIFPALRSRFREIQLNDFSKDEIFIILKNNIQNNLRESISFEIEAVKHLCDFCLNSGRRAVLIAQDVARYINAYKDQIDVFNKNHADYIIKDILDLFPLGLTRNEVNILKHIAEFEEDGVSLTQLQAFSGLTMSAQRDFEKSLLANCLIDINGKRKITTKGLNYLKDAKSNFGF